MLPIFWPSYSKDILFDSAISSHLSNLLFSHSSSSSLRLCLIHVSSLSVCLCGIEWCGVWWFMRCYAWCSCSVTCRLTRSDVKWCEVVLSGVVSFRLIWHDVVLNRLMQGGEGWFLVVRTGAGWCQVVRNNANDVGWCMLAWNGTK